MNISQKLITGLIILGLLFVITAAAGLKGVNMVGDSLRFTTGPAWNAADGAMEGTIGIQTEIIAMQRSLLSEITYQQASRDIKEANQFGNTAIGRMLNSGLMATSEVNDLKKQLSQFRLQRDLVLSLHQQQERSWNTLNGTLLQIDELLEQAEEEIEQSMDNGNLISMDLSRIQLHWNAADAIMETRIALLRREHALELIMDNHPTANEAYGSLPTLLADAKELIGVVFGSELITDRIKNNLQQHFSDYQEQFDRLLSQNQLFHTARQDLASTNQALLGMIEMLEESGDSKVEQTISDVAPIIATAQGTIWITAGAGLLLIAMGAFYLIKVVLARLKMVASRMHEISEGEGDLTITLEADGHDELAQLAGGFNGFVAKTRKAVLEVRHSVEALKQANSQMAETIQQTLAGILRQQTETNLAATAVTQMAATMVEVSQNAHNVAQSTADADQKAGQGKQIVNETVDSISHLAGEVNRSSEVINRLDANSENIGSVLSVIRDIAEQTNLLALNAAIEAARAGEQGRGFAVVADEVRTLASRTQQSTEEIQSMIEKIQAGTREAVMVMKSSHQRVDVTVNQAQQAGNVLEAFTQSVSLINAMNTQIAAAAEELSSVADDVSRNVTNIHDETNKTADGVHQVDHTSKELLKLSDRLDLLVGQFKVQVNA